MDITMMHPKEVDKKLSSNRFLLLLIALTILLLSYPYFSNTVVGATLGGLTSLGMYIFGVYAVRVHRWAFITAVVLAVMDAAINIVAMVQGTRGHPLVEGAYLVFDAFITVIIFFEVIRTKEIDRDAIFGIVCVYLLIGVTFGTLYDLLETLVPGSFQINVTSANVEYVGWRVLIFFSFMTLTTIGYGDVTPVTFQAQSLALIEGVIGVLYVAVLIARIVGIYSQRSISNGTVEILRKALKPPVDDGKEAP
jgi:hypothetical protein